MEGINKSTKFQTKLKILLFKIGRKNFDKNIKYNLLIKNNFKNTKNF